MSKSSPSLQWMRRHLKAPLTTLMLTSLSLWSTQVKGASYTWIGGSGNWDTTTPSWSGAPWSNAGAHTAVFGGTAGTVTLAEAIAAGGLTFNSTGYAINGASPLILSGAPSSVINVNGLGSRATIDAPVAGSGQIVKTGNGNLVLSNTGNNFTGNILINQGGLVITNPAQLGNASLISINGFSSTNFTGGSLILNGGLSGITVDKDISLSGRGMVYANAGGTGAIVNIGAKNTLSGNLSFSNGSESRVLTNYGILNVTGDVLLSSGNMASFGGNGNVIISGKVSGGNVSTDRFGKIGAYLTSTMWLQNADNDHVTDLRMDSGTVRVSTSAALGQAGMSTTSLDFNNGGIEILTDNPDFSNRTIRVRDFTTGNIFVSRALGGSGLNQNVVFGATSAANVSTVLTVTGRDGYGTTFSGNSLGNFGSGGANNATFNNNSNGLYVINAPNVWNQTDTTGARTFTIQGNGDSLITGSILATGNAHAFTKGGSGVVTLQGNAGTFTGSATVSAGTLNISSIGALNSSSSGGRVVFGGGTLNYTGAAETWTNKVLLMNATNSLLTNNGTGALTIPQNIGANTTAAKTLFLGGANTGVNDIQGIITNNTVQTGVTKFDDGVWQISTPSAASYGSAATGLAAANTSGQATFTVVNTAGLVVGQPISGAGIPVGSVITQINSSTQFTINANTTAGVSSVNLAPVSGATAALTTTAVSTGTTTAPIITVASTAGLVPGQPVTGGALAGGNWYISSITSATTVTLASASGATMTVGAVASGASVTPSGSANFAGPLTITGGSVVLNSTSATAELLNNSANVVFNTDPVRGTQYAGGTLEYKGFTSGSTEVAGSLVPTAGAGRVVVTPGTSGTTSLSFAALGARGTGATLNFAPGTGTGIQFLTAPAGSNGILGGYAYITDPATGSIDFVATPAANTNIAALGSVTALPAATGSAAANYVVGAGGVTTTGAVAANSVRLAGGSITLGGTLTVTSTGATTLGGILHDNTAGAASITGAFNITPSGSNQELVIITGGSTPANALTINSVLAANGTSGVTKAGTGTLIVSGNNTFTGTLTINEGIVRPSGATATLGAPAAATVSVIRQGASLDLNAAGASVTPYTGATARPNVTMAPTNGAGNISTTASGLQSISFGNTSSTGSAVFSGIISDGAGTVSVIRNGASGNQALTGLNTYTGQTVLNGGVLQVNSLADGGQPSSIGQSSSAASNLVFNGGTLQYTGSNATIFQTTQTPSISIDRQFTLAGNGTIDSSGQYGNNVLGAGNANNAALIFNSTADITFAGTGTRTLTLQGGSTGDNELRIRLTNNAGSALSFTKAGTGLWILNPSSANDYTGSTQISGGALQAIDGVGIPSGSNIAFNNSTGGVFQSAGTTPVTLARTIGTGGSQFSWGAFGSGGFSAGTVPLTVNLNGNPVWGSTPGFLGTGNLILSSTSAFADTTVNGDFSVTAGVTSVAITTTASSANATVASTAGLTVGQVITGNSNIPAGTYITAITSATGITLSTGTGVLAATAAASTLSGGYRQIQVDDNGATGLDFATVTGVISGTGGLGKSGGGNLILGGANTYSGGTFINNGVVIAQSIGADNATATSLGTNVGGGAVNIGLTTTAGTLMYVGTGETTTRTINLSGTTGGATIDNSGSGPLILNSVVNSGVGAKTLTLRGSNTDANELISNLVDNGSNILTVTKADGGNWTLSGTNTFTGNLNINGGLLFVGNAAALGAVGTGNIVFSNGGLSALGGTLTVARPVQIAANTQATFTGLNSIVLTNTVTGVNGNPWTIQNTIAQPGSLTISGNFNSLEGTATARTLTISGTGDTNLTGVLQGTGASNGAVSLVVSTANSAVTTLGGISPNLITGTSNELRQGILVLAKANALGTVAASTFNLNGGELRSTVSGTNIIPNNITLAGSIATVNGTGTITFGGTLTNSGGNRILRNDLTGGAVLNIGAVSLTNDTNARTLSVIGSGTTNITGIIANGGSGVSGLTYLGDGSLNLTGTSTFTGAATFTGGTTTLSGTGGSIATTSGVTVNQAILTLDNGTNNLANRLGSKPIALNGATLNLLGSSTGLTEGAAANTTSTLTVGTGTSTINSVRVGGTNTTTFASLTINTGGSLNFTGGVGTATNKILFTTAPALSPATTGILARATVEGADFATYDATNGVVAFTGYSIPADVNSTTSTQTLKVNSTTTNRIFGSNKTINALAIDGTGLTVGTTSGAILTVTSAGILTTNGANTLAARTTLGAEGAFHIGNGASLNVTGIMSGTSGFNKNLGGTLTFSVPQYVSGTQTFNGGTTILNGGDNTLFPGQTLLVNPGATLDLNGNSQYVLAFGGGNNPGTGGIVTSSVGSPLFTANGTVAYGGQITGAINFNKTGSGTMTAESPLAYTGTTTLTGGTLTLRDSATLLNTSAITLNFATLNLDNNANLGVAIANRVGDNIPITSRGGSITYQARFGDAGSETLGALTLSEGASTINLNAANNANGTVPNLSAELTLASISRLAGTTLNINSNQALGISGNANRLYLTNAPTTLANGMIGAWAIANNTDFAAYDPTMGLGAFGYGGFTAYDTTFGSGKVTQIVTNATTVTTTLSGNTTTGALRLAGGAPNDIAFTASGDVLNLQTGGLLRSNQGAVSTIGTTGTRGVLTAGGNATSGNTELVVYNHSQVQTSAGASSLDSNVLTVSSTANIGVGASITGTGIPAGAVVTEIINATSIRISIAASSAQTNQTYTYTGAVTINSVIKDTKDVIGTGTATVSLVKSGTAPLTLTANNTYSGGSTFNQGTVNLAGTGVVIPAGGLTLSAATLNMLNNAGQIDFSNDVVLNDGSTLNLRGDNTLNSVTFNNFGGTSTPTINTNGILSLSDTNAITVTSNNVATVPTIAGFVELGSSAKTFNIGAIQVGGQVVSAITSSLNITAVMTGAAPVTKTGAGLLQLSGQSTFYGGLNITAGGLVIGGNSSPTTGGAGVTSGPLGSSAVTMAAGTRLLVDASRTIANDVHFSGTPTFDSTVNSATTFTLNGELTGLANGATTIQINNPSMTVALLGTIPNIGSITSFNKTGPGILIFNATGYTGNFNAVALGSQNTISLLHDGNAPNIGNGVVETIPLGSVTFDTNGTSTVTVGRAGGSLPFGLAVNKIIAPSSINTALTNGLIVANNNGYGLAVSDSGALVGTPTFTVNTASNSNVTQGLYLNGLLSGTGFIKTGAGALVLGNNSNSFTGNININQGVLSVSNNGQMGTAANMVLLNPQTGTATFRATDNITTNRVIQLSNTANTRAIEVVAGKTLQLTSAFDLNAGAGTAAALTKSDLGTLALNANNASWTGVLTIGQGVVSVMNSGALGTTAGNTIVSANGAALQLVGGISLAEPLNLTGSGISNAGALQGTGAGVSTQSGAITLGGTTTIGADLNNTLLMTGGITGAQALTFAGEGTTRLTTTALGAVSSVTKVGLGTTSLGVASNSFVGNLVVNRGTFLVNGVGSIGGTGSITINPSGTLTIDNLVASGGNANNRLGTRAITFVGGNFNVIGGDAADTTETLAAPTFNRGLTTITVTAQTGRQANLVFNAAANNPTTVQNSGTGNTGASVIFRGTNLGTAAGAGVATIANSTGGFTFAGQTGALNTKNKGLLPWALVDSSVTGIGTSFATADTATGILRALNASEYETANTFVASNNINLTSGTTGIGAATLNINSLTMAGNAGVTIPSLLQLTSSSGGILVKSGSSTISGGSLVQINTTTPFNIWTTGDLTELTISSVLSGGNGQSAGAFSLVKAGSGTLTLTTPLATIPGLTDIGANTLSGQIAINQGTLKLAGGKNTLQANNYLTIESGGTLDLNGTSQQVYAFANSSSVSGAGGTITNSSATTAHFITNQDNTGRNWTGNISGNVNFTRSGQNTLNVYSPQTYTGTTLINGGTTTLRDDGALVNTSAIAITYATLVADSATSTVNSTMRINNTAPITLTGGSLQVLGRAQTNSSEVLGAVSLAGGHSSIITNAGGTNINSLEVTIASLARTSDTATLRFNATGQLGSSARLFITANPTLTNNIIGPWAIVDREYASYSAAYGVGPLNGNGFAGYAGSGLNSNPLPTDNVRFTNTGTTTMLADTTVGTLTFGQQGSATILNLGGNTLTLRSGGLLFGQGTDNVDFSITNGSITSGVLNTPSDFYLTHANYSGTNRTVTINAGIVDNGTGAVRLIKTSGDTGVSLMTLNGVNTYTGGTIVNGGTLNIGATSNIPLAATPATGLILRGGTVTTNAAGAIAAGNTATLEGTSVLSFYGDNSIEGLVFNNSGGSTAPTVLTYSTLATAGSGSNGVLTIGSGGIVATSAAVGQTGTATGPSVSSIGYTSAIDGRVDFGSAGNTINVATINANGTNDIAPLAAGFNLRGVVGSTGGFTKTGDGVLGISAQSFFTGPVVVSAGGLRNSAVNGGSRFSALTLQSGTRLDLNGLAATWGSLAGSGTVFNSSINAATLTVGFDNTSSTFSGQIVRFNDAILNSVALTKVGTGTLNMTSAQSATNGSNGTFTVNGGTLSFNGAGAWFTSASTMAATFTVNSGGTLALDNSGTNLNNRLGLQTTGTLNVQGGKLAITGNSASATTNTITTFNVTNGGGRIELSPNGSSALTLAITTLNTANGSGSLVIGGITGAASAAGVANLTITTPNLIGGQGGGANGSTTMSLRHDILGDASISGLGTGFLVRDSVTTNYRALASNELAASIPLPLTADVDPLTSGNQAAGTQNVGLSTTQAISVNSVANTLTISGTAVVNSGLDATAFGKYGPGGGLLTFSLSNAAASLTLAGATGTINTGAFGSTSTGTTPYVHVIAGGTLNVNGAFAVNGTAGMLKADGGVLNLNNRAYYTGATTVNNGTVNLNSGFENTLAVVPAATNPTLTALNLNSSTSVVDLKGYNQAVGALSSINPLPGMGGSVINSGATPAVFTTSTQSTGSTFAGQIGGGTVGSPVNADISLVRAGANTLTLTNANTYTGATVIRGGTLQLRDSGSILNSSSITVNYGALTNDNFGLNASGTPNPTRISPTTPVTLLGGTINVIGAGATDNTLVINNLTVAGGGNTISVQPQINEGSTVDVTIGNLMRSTTDHNTINFNGFSQQNSASGVSTLGGQGLSANGNIILNQINGDAAPTSYVLTATTTAGNPLVTVNSTTGLVVGMAVSGSGIPAGATIAAINSATSITLNTGTGVTAVTNSAVNANIGLTNNLIGGWAVADGSTFATYVTGYGVSVMGQTTQGIAAPGFTGTDVSLATVATGNYNDGTSRTLSTGVKAANSWRMAPSATQNITPVSGTSLSFGVGVITNSGSTVNFLAVDATNTITGTGSDLYYYANQGTSIINMAIVGSASLVTSGGGTVRLAPQFASNSYTGGTYVNGGTLNLQAYPGFVAIPGDLVINNAAVTSAVPSSTVAANQVIASSNITINGGGSFTLPNYTTGPTNTYASLSFDNQGGSANPTFSFGTPTTLTSTVVLTASNAITANNDSIATTPVISTGAATLTALQLSNAAPFITTTGSSPNGLNIQVPITSAGGTVTKLGGGSLTLSGANTFTNGFNLTQGSLIFGSGSTGTAPSVTNGPVGTGTLTIAGGTSILSDGTARTVGNATTVNGDFTFGGVNSGNNVTLSGAMSLGSAGRTLTVTSPAVTATISGAITGTGTGTALTKAGNGTLILSSASSNFNGAAVAVTGGILKNGVTNAIPAASPLVISAGAGYDLNGFNQTINQISGDGFITVSNNASQTLTIGGTSSSSTFNGVLTDNRLGQASSALLINKVGSGSLVLTNVNTYNGTTTVTGGVLQIGTNASLTATSGTGLASVLTGATLAGTGTIGGNASIAAGGILSPGDATAALTVDQNGTLTVKGTLTTVIGGTTGGQIRLNLSSSAYNDPAFAASGMTVLSYYNTLNASQKDAWNTAPSTINHNYDHISVGGALTLTSGTASTPTIVVTTTQDYGYGTIFNLFDWNMLTTRDSGSIGTFNPNSANDLLLPTLGNGLTWDTSLFTTAGIIVVVPEPSRMLMLFFAFMALAFRRRRR